jgi:ubiquitin carboxyl-terminal hydrolase 40
VKGNNSLEESIMQFITPEKLDGNNCYFCELCQKKCEALKGVKIRKLPQILTISLNRFEFDYQTFERKKVNDRLEFGLELDMSAFTEEENENSKYELQTVLIHIGNAHGGHYHAYIRDSMGEGKW